MVYSACDHCRSRGDDCFPSTAPRGISSKCEQCRLRKVACSNTRANPNPTSSTSVGTSVGASSARPITLDSPPPPITIPSSPATNRRLASPSTSPVLRRVVGSPPLSPLSGSSLPVVASGRRRPRALQGHRLDSEPLNIARNRTRRNLPAVDYTIFPLERILAEREYNFPPYPPQPALATESRPDGRRVQRVLGVFVPRQPAQPTIPRKRRRSPSPTPRASTSQSRDLGVGPSRRPDGADPLQQALEDFAGENEGVWGELQRIVPSPDRSRLQELRDLQSKLLSSLEQRLQQQLLAATPNVSTSTPTPEGTPPLM
ncbi:hypothetical protein MJO28_016765 [Puccinia striiformis f. sp. tritici]|uniref:Uncharacterized protein n=1 Tax=Puccinia striiformis f. sp. tritici TaxID=168172 RepID=A0ACC0DQ88_9BASI|nr:hypothetical protein MJO28_016765 [Puccinia striiformis f. sp. tritici]